VDTAAARGNVDEWLLWVEDRMIKCVQKVHQDGFYDFVKYDRAKWVLGRCGMAVLCINMTYWTSNSEKALNDEGNAGVSKYAKVCAS
jgi:dynein heavy chain